MEEPKDEGGSDRRRFGPAMTVALLLIIAGFVIGLDWLLGQLGLGGP